MAQTNLEGRIIAVHSAFCIVASEGNDYRCVLRGRIRRETDQVFPGDLVTVDKKHGRFVIDRVHPRRNLLIRPPVANVDQMVVVTAITSPPKDTLGTDRLLVHGEMQGITGAICINKCDLEDPEEVSSLKEIYENAGYPVIVTSATEGKGLDELSESIEGTVFIVAGASGVGKSRILSKLLGIEIEVRKLGRTGRGRHTTKGVTLYKLGRSGFLADTPGFNKVTLPDCEPHELATYYPEMAQYTYSCYYPRCLHKTETLCQVKSALQEGKISPERYANYLVLLEECLEKEKRKYE